MRYTINIIERLGVVFLAIMISNILDLYNIAESNFAFVVIALILFSLSFVKLYFKASYKKYWLKEIKCIVVNAFFGIVLTTLELFALKLILNIDINKILQKPLIVLIIIFGNSVFQKYLRTSERSKKVVKDLIERLHDGLLFSIVITIVLHVVFKLEFWRAFKNATIILIMTCPVEMISKLYYF